MIKHIIQISDIHIPNQLDGRPYDVMIQSFLKELYTYIVDNNIEKDELRIVLVGDIYHQKIKISNEARSILHFLLNYLNKIGNTIIIAGNHDLLENNHDKLDSLTPTFEVDGVYENITYADMTLDYKSGCIEDENVIWALYSIFDSYNQPQIPKTEKTIIGLFHGDINSAKTDAGHTCEYGLTHEHFTNCDIVMAGHIHKYQEIKQKGIPIVYSGSLFQQNSGENTTTHGFVHWELENKTHKHIEVTNNYKIYKFKVTSFDDFKNNQEKLLNL